MTTPRDDISGLIERLAKAVYDGMEGAGTLPAKDSVKVRPKDWHKIIDVSREAATAIDALQARVKELEKENGILRDMLLNPDPDIEPDNLRLHREKCDAIDRALVAEARALRAEQERDEARKAANLGCDAYNGGAHTIMVEGSYKFCTGCGETIRTPTLQERARAAESRATRLQQERDSYERLYNDEVVNRLRAEQERDEAYERAAKVAERRSMCLPHDSDIDRGYALGRCDAAAAIRQLASGPEKEKKE